ncbi:hypothetical protein [uncultured Thiodictyon sp.]|uniref:hypothetical protein n=1 Tax=uncultured Thiodictyon sp. TaxID=1846217 RepID=UPI0025D4DC73|nr:hypothetical protein [uncultured Thiodictyon sp.]
MMNQGQARLTQDVLNAIAATDPEDTQRLADERLRAVIDGRQPLTPPERRLLARSAATRDRLAWLRHLTRAQALAAWQAQALGPQPLQLLAAADETPAVAPVQLVGEHYSVALIPVDLEGLTWRIAVQIAPPLIAATPGGFQLLDSEGLVWLAGHPDAAGELVGFWQREEPLWQRVHRVRLELVPQ